MYRDLSAQLAAKEIELTEARETIAKLEERVRELETHMGEVTGGMANRDAVLKSALNDNEELRKERDDLRAAVSSLNESVAALKRQRYNARTLFDDLAEIVRDRMKK
jgi:chromosome segregation ATPase